MFYTYCITKVKIAEYSMRSFPENIVGPYCVSEAGLDGLSVFE